MLIVVNIKLGFQKVFTKLLPFANSKKHTTDYWDVRVFEFVRIMK